jgi:hypothetical protein
MNILDQAGAGAADYFFGYDTNPYMCNNGGWTISQLQQMAMNQQSANYSHDMARSLDVNASTESVYPVKNGNSMNKKLEAAKKYLKERG